MTIFDPNIFNPNIFATTVAGESSTETSVVEKKRSRGRTRSFLKADIRKLRKVFNVYESTKSVPVTSFMPNAIVRHLEVASIRLEDINPQAVAALANELLESAMTVLPPDITADDGNRSGGFLDVLAAEMLAESFRQDIIPVAIQGSVEDAVKSAWLGNFSGLNREQSEYTRAILQDAFRHNASHSATIARLQRFVGIDYEQAKTIVDTEFQQIRNRARMLAYQEDETEDSRYIWDTQRDARVCEICASIKRNTLPGGLRMEDLLEVITEAQYHFGADSARRYIAHVGDRCRISRLK